MLNNFPDIKTETYFQVFLLWKEKNWNLSNNAFYRFCKLFEILSDDEKKLIYKLTKEEFLLIEYGDYPIYLYYAIEKLKVKYPNINKIFLIFASINLPDSERISKSSVNLIYHFKTPPFKDSISRLDLKYVILNDLIGISPDLLTIEKINDDPNSFLVVYDDYIGSGETIKESVNFLLRKGFNREKIKVICIAAQMQGINFLSTKGIETFAAFERSRGISDRYSDEEKKLYQEIMRRIENKINVEFKYKFGCYGSEGLISLMRTPDNTFPVYWWNDKSISFEGPFLR